MGETFVRTLLGMTTYAWQPTNHKHSTKYMSHVSREMHTKQCYCNVFTTFSCHCAPANAIGQLLPISSKTKHPGFPSYRFTHDICQI